MLRTKGAAIGLILFFLTVPLRSEEKPKQKKTGRGILETACFISLSQAKYWIKYSKYIEDWQFELSWKDQKRRFFSLEAQKFDSNDFRINWTHALAGAIYYNFARSNRMSVLESSLLNAATSLYWEFIVEWREVVSVNDNVFTGIGGIPIGETFYQLGEYFQNQPGWFNKGLGIVLNPILAFNRWLDRKRPLPSLIPQKECLFLQAGICSHSPETFSHLNLVTRLNHLPKIEESPHIVTKLKNGYRSELSFQGILKKTRFEEINLWINSSYFGNYNHHVDESEKGRRFILGAGSGFNYHKKRAVWEWDSRHKILDVETNAQMPQPTAFTDKWAILNLFGPELHYSLFSNKTRLTLDLAVYGDFSLINAYALNKYSWSYNINTTKTTLKNYGYYYSLGYTLQMRLGLMLGPISMKGYWTHHYFNSVEGIDRFQDRLEEDFNLQDKRTISGIQIEYRLRDFPMGLYVTLEHKTRWGKIKNVHNSDTETRLFYGATVFL